MQNTSFFRSWEVSALFLHHAFVFFPSSFPWFQIYLGLGLGWKKNKRKDIWLLIWWPLPCLGASAWQMFKVKYFAEHVFLFSWKVPQGIFKRNFLWYRLGNLWCQLSGSESCNLQDRKAQCYSCLCFTIWDLPHIGFLCWSLIAPHAVRSFMRWLSLNVLAFVIEGTTLCFQCISFS